MITLTNRQARQLLLTKHGLLGDHKFAGKDGALGFVRQAGCIQYDPVDVCGKNAELTLQSRVKGFTKDMLDELLYQDRSLFDFPDKNLSVVPIEQWPYFERYREVAREGGLRFAGLAEMEGRTKEYIRDHGPVCSDDLPLQGKMHWHSSIHWSGEWRGETNAARAVLEQLYSTGDLVIHHKNGTRKYYDLAEKYIPMERLRAPEPLPDEFEHQKWRVLRRIGAVGFLWNRPSDAWINIWGMKSSQRNDAIRALSDEGKIISFIIEGLKDILYCRADDRQLIEAVSQGLESAPRCEFIAPLDPLMWDRKLVKALFGFEYTWEIYTPAYKRKFGVYVLPILWGERFVGRIEAVCERKTDTLAVKNVWYESGVRQTAKLQKAIDGCLKRFSKFNGCKAIQY
ncbi:MAG: winged helix DNA-binding domain-containing protein [Peptococcaceae bacterium]|jgi:uncharacterized protein YcaQ|nr:winged helix DNA-binding domain-containing protein [Peptococcaceae bacterium]